MEEKGLTGTNQAFGSAGQWSPGVYPGAIGRPKILDNKAIPLRTTVKWWRDGFWCRCGYRTIRPSTTSAPTISQRSRIAIIWLT
jgi:hypothetical protein